MQHGSFDEHDQREVRRRHLIYNLAAVDADSGAPLGRVVDLTHDGVSLISSAPLPVDEVFHMRIKIPAHLTDCTELVFRARSRWCRRDVNDDYFDTGFQLLEVSDAHTMAVRRLISSYGFDD